MLAFSWPTVTSEPKDVPVDVVAEQQAFDALTQQAGEESPFLFNRVDSQEEATAHIQQRESYGALVLPAQPGQSLEILTAPAANNAITQMLTTAGTGMYKAQIGTALASGQVTDPQALTALTQQALEGPTITAVAPLSQDDPQGAGLGVAALPLTLGGIIGGVLISFTVRGAWRKLGALVVYAAAAAGMILLVLHTWFALLPTASLALWAAFALSIGATSSLVIGLHSLLGTPGIALGAITTMFIGNPISGSAMPFEFLPWHFDVIGQSFVPGATQVLLRNLSYFPEASNTSAWIALTCWAGFGLLCLAASQLRKPKEDNAAEVETTVEAAA